MDEKWLDQRLRRSALIGNSGVFRIGHWDNLSGHRFDKDAR
jgi:hypothetical protein